MLSRPLRGERPAFSAGRREKNVRILSRPRRGEGPAYAAVRREESVGDSPQAVQRRAFNIRRRPYRGGRRAFSAGHAGVSSMLSCPLRGERPELSAGRQE